MAELLAGIGSDELTEWMALDRYIAPLPDSYWQAGIVAATVANAMGSKGGHKPADFMPALETLTADSEAPERPRGKSVAENRAALLGFMSRMKK